MIGYVTLGSNDLPKAVAFYEELLSEMGAKRVWDTENFVAWSPGSKSPAIAVVKPYDGEEATVGNGSMTAIAAPSREVIDALHAKALELGGTDEGGPRLRGGVFYGAYFRDLDGNKLCAFKFERPQD